MVICCLLSFKMTAYSQVSTAKPWTFWWWMGSAVNEKDITHSLLDFKKAGIGGVHIIPIYGVKGYESQFQPFLGDKWMKSLQYTLAEGKRLGIGVDLSNGSGWPFGGPNVNQEMSAKHWVLKNEQFTSEGTKQKVKRPSPGGQGLVLDPFDKKLMRQYLARFDSAFAGKDLSGLRSTYSDSYEVFGANWTNNFLEEFKKRRGYDLQSVSKLFLDTTNVTDGKLIRIDYQQTLSELLYESSQAWTTWSAEHHFKTRYQAHGSPGNILDLYSLASIPETEAFGSSNFPIPLLRVDPDFQPKSFGRPNPLMMKFASSAAGVSGKQLISSETCTWLANHFHVSLSQVKPQVDELFAAGINHIFFHGTTYSPQADPYPGWLFYASTNFGESSHFYKEFPLLNKYIFNCQTILQNSKTDNDVLVYFPIQDVWADQGSGNNGIHQLDVHHSENWFLAHPFGKICQDLAKKGFSFDYISDMQLGAVKVEKGEIHTVSGKYKILVVPDCAYLSKSTLDRLLALGQQGVTIIFEKGLPKTVAGYVNHQQNTIAFEKIEETMKSNPQHFLISNDLEKDLVSKGASQEKLAVAGLSFIRKIQNGKVVYFVTNLSNKFSSGWIGLSKADMSHDILYDPLTEQRSTLPIRKNKGSTEIYLSLLPGKSCFIMEDAKPQVINSAPPKSYSAYPVNTKWQLKFDGGRPDYHQAFSLDSLQSWTSLSDTSSFYSGVARYTGSVNIPAMVIGKKDLVIDLGNVKESAVVKINGKYIGTAWSIPFLLKIPANVLTTGKNTLEIAVTNLSANYMRIYDKQHPEWRKFYDANIVDITYQPFNASKWTIMPSGLVDNDLKILYR